MYCRCQDVEERPGVTTMGRECSRTVEVTDVRVVRHPHRPGGPHNRACRQDGLLWVWVDGQAARESPGMLDVLRWRLGPAVTTVLPTHWARRRSHWFSQCWRRVRECRWCTPSARRAGHLCWLLRACRLRACTMPVRLRPPSLCWPRSGLADPRSTPRTLATRRCRSMQLPSERLAAPAGVRDGRVARPTS